MRRKVEDLGRDVRVNLSAWIRTQGRPDLEIGNENLKEICEGFPTYRVSEKQLLLLRYLETKTSYPGVHVDVKMDADYPVIWAQGGDELKFHLEELADRGLIKVHGPKFSTISITTNGWAFLDENPSLADVGNQAFVAMSFSAQMKPVFFHGIKPALERAGYRAYRVDLEEHSKRIDATIEHEILNSAFVVADVTGRKQGVYYEAGFARGHGLPVIWSVKAEEMDQVHFDTRQYPHILWTDKAELERELYYRVSMVVGKRGGGGP